MLALVEPGRKCLWLGAVRTLKIVIRVGRAVSMTGEVTQVHAVMLLDESTRGLQYCVYRRTDRRIKAGMAGSSDDGAHEHLRSSGTNRFSASNKRVARSLARMAAAGPAVMSPERPRPRPPELRVAIQLEFLGRLNRRPTGFYTGNAPK